ncbi:recombinase RecT [Veillonella criceti]|uniref:P33 n=1 Tax=Veillonella criceti TaxID=103891 RepID=A0A380NJV3_9FIRM|nr:recombinase RecT [Veillonella criceti]SUP42426.1 P33 [Veillonella criceti]
MATTNGIALKNNHLKPATKAPTTLNGMLASDDVKKRFNELLGNKAPGFISSLLSVANNNKLLAKADPKTVIAAGAMAAALDLPVNQNLGYAYIVPYGNEAQFQMGYKGYIQLAMRTGQYKTINACEVYEGEIRNTNRFTGEFEFGERTGDEIVGYMAYFKLINGFEKYIYMTMAEMQAHARKYSKTYKGGTDKWGIADFHSMAIKTVLKRLISKYGILSIEMRAGLTKAIETDGGIIKDHDGTLEADFETIEVDGTYINAETGEVVDEVGNTNELTEEEKAAILAAEQLEQ